MSDKWMTIDSAPEMVAILLHHEYYSHGQCRMGFNQGGVWTGVNADGTHSVLHFDPTHWMRLPRNPQGRKP